MALYNYSARDQRGSIQTGTLEAASEDEVITRLQHRGLIVTTVSTMSGGGEKSGGSGSSGGSKALVSSMPRRMHNKVKIDDHVSLCQQLGTLVEAGVPLLRSLKVVNTQVESKKLYHALETVRKDVEGGDTLREALSKHPDVFSNLWINLVETGEASGHLSEALNQLAHHFEAAQKLQNEARTAMTYPLFLIGVATLVIILFVYWLIPKFTGMFASIEMELPLITRFVIAVSDGAKQYWYLVAGGVGTFVFLLKRYLATEAGKWSRDKLMLSLPLFKMLFTYIQLAEFTRGMATLLTSGVPLMQCLHILENSASNRLYRTAIGAVKVGVKEGKTMAEPMAETGMFPPLAVQMVQVGEEVGELAEVIGKLAKFYEIRVEMFIARMTRLFEPIAIVVMGGIVLFIVLSIFMPIFKMATGPSM